MWEILDGTGELCALVVFGALTMFLRNRDTDSLSTCYRAIFRESKMEPCVLKESKMNSEMKHILFKTLNTLTSSTI